MSTRISHQYHISIDPSVQPLVHPTRRIPHSKRDSLKKGIKGVSLLRNCGAASVVVLQDNLVSSTELTMQIGHCKEIRKLTFRALALRRSVRRRANARNVSFRISLQWPIYIVNSVDETKLSLKKELDRMESVGIIEKVPLRKRASRLG